MGGVRSPSWCEANTHSWVAEWFMQRTVNPCRKAMWVRVPPHELNAVVAQWLLHLPCKQASYDIVGSSPTGGSYLLPCGVIGNTQDFSMGAPWQKYLV